MKMNAADIPFLKCQKFTNDLCLGLSEIGSGTTAFDRLEFLRQTVSGMCWSMACMMGCNHRSKRCCRVCFRD